MKVHIEEGVERWQSNHNFLNGAQCDPLADPVGISPCRTQSLALGLWMFLGDVSIWQGSGWTCKEGTPGKKISSWRILSGIVTKPAIKAQVQRTSFQFKACNKQCTSLESEMRRPIPSQGTIYIYIIDTLTQRNGPGCTPKGWSRISWGELFSRKVSTYL